MLREAKEFSPKHKGMNGRGETSIQGHRTPKSVSFPLPPCIYKRAVGPGKSWAGPQGLP